MTTFAVMKARIADDMVRDDLASQISTAVAEAIKQWEAERFHFNEKRFRILTVASQEYYDLAGPTLLSSSGTAVETGETVLEIDSITCTISAGQQPYPLTSRTHTWLSDNQSTTSLSDPADYGIYGDQLRLSPIPRGVTTLDLHTLARLKTLTADLDSNAWMTEGEVLIRNQAKLQLYRDILRDADGATAAALAIFGSPAADYQDGALPSLKRKMGAKVMTGRVKAWNL